MLFPAKICAISFTVSFDIYMKWKLGYPMFVLQIEIEISSNSGKHLPDFNCTEGFLSP